MNAILTVACIGMVVGFFLMFEISPMEFTEGIFTRILAKPNSIKSQINEATKRKKPNVFRREISEAQEILRLTNSDGTEYSVYGLSVNVDNAQFAPTSGDIPQFSATSYITLEVPLSFCGDVLPPMKIQLCVKSKYTPKF